MEADMSKVHSTIDFLEAGLRAENLRQKAIANNVANSKTNGYRTIDVKFEELLAKAMDSSGDVDLSKVEAQIFQPGTTPLKANGNDVSMETEVGKLVENSLRYKTYIRLLSKKYAQIEMATNTKV